MRFKIVENLPAESQALFGQAKHTAVTALAQGLGGGPDSALAAVCRSEARALVTLDLAFADIRAYPPTEYAGLVLRPASQPKALVLNLLQSVIDRLPSEGLAGR